MNPTVWTTEFMIKDLRYQASLKKGGDYCMERAADRLEKLEKESDETRAEIDRLTTELIHANPAQIRPEPSRLEIAAMLMAGGITAGAGYDALRYADFLIAQAKQPK
jgi:hypothetical protein